MTSIRAPWFKWSLTATVTLLALYAVLLVYATGQTLLAVVLLAMSSLALWTWTSTRTHALRYLLPGITAAVVFVIFPMLYTIGIGFTNQSSRNLLNHDQARALLLAESVPVANSARRFELLADGNLWRVRLPAQDGHPAWETPLLRLEPNAPQTARLGAVSATGGSVLPLHEVVAQLPALRALSLQGPDGNRLTLATLHTFASFSPLYMADGEGALTDTLTQTSWRADFDRGFYTNAQGETLQPGFRVNVGFGHYARLFTDDKFRQPFLSVFVWTVVFAALSVLLAAALGLVLAVLLKWDRLQFKAAYRLVLFLPYAVPGFISILVFKGLFNQNLGEINLILHGLFGIKPAWFSDPLLAKVMLLIVNVWLGFPYMMVLCAGLVNAIPADIYEAAAVEGAGPLTTFARITMPLIVKPLTPLLISAFAFNFNNFVLVSLLTGGRPDVADAALPAGTTDILVSYTWRIAFQDSGQEFGLAAAISTVIFLIVAAITLLQMRWTRLDDPTPAKP